MRLRAGPDGGVTDGAVVGFLDGAPIRVRYEVTSDSRWHVRTVSLEVIAPERRLLALAADEAGVWKRVDGGVLDVPIFRCFDVSIGVTPAPAALTLRRLALEPRGVAIVNVAAITIPTLAIRSIEVRYTRLEDEGNLRVYRCENFDSGERVRMRVDADGTIAEPLATD